MKPMQVHPSSLLLFGATFMALFGAANSLQEFADNIPNGHSVPNPGPQGGVWAGVGHLNAGGGGERNPFGLDFAAQGYEWTTELCELDSDGDGRSNGVELGDPECIWFKDGPEPSGPAVSHPGIVDEASDRGALNYCDDYKEPDQVEVFDITFSTPNQVDETQTHYICEQQRIEINIPQKPYQLIRTSVILDNPDLLHHMFVYVCPVDTVPSDGDRAGEGAYDCFGTTENNCITTTAGWAIGHPDSCLPSNVGTEFDLTGGSNALIKIEAHYDNALRVPQQDQSGMKFFVTPELRPLTAGSMVLGMPQTNNDFQIPGSVADYTLSNICPSEATRLLTHPIYVFEFTPHMHYYGYKLYTEHWRCGQKIGEIGRINEYEFDNQQSYLVPVPTRVIPGDALVTKCHYNTEGHGDTVYGGGETSDEMCLDFLGYYPRAGTEENPTLMSACVSVLHGIVSDNPILQNIRVAVTNREMTGILREFEEDPTKSWAECCDVGNCDELYIAQVGEACGSDSDCDGELLCDGGLCSEIEPEDIRKPLESSDPMEAGQTSGVVAADKLSKYVLPTLLCLVGIAAEVF